MKHNFVAKNMHKFCRSAVMTDKKKEHKIGKEKHKQNFKKDHNGPF